MAEQVGDVIGREGEDRTCYERGHSTRAWTEDLACQQVRAEPPNPKKPYVWQNSTIASDTMMRPLV